MKIKPEFRTGDGVYHDTLNDTIVHTAANPVEALAVAQGKDQIGMRIRPYRCPRPKVPARLNIPCRQNPAHYIASFDRLNKLKPGVAFIIGGVCYDGH